MTKKTKLGKSGKLATSLFISILTLVSVGGFVWSLFDPKDFQTWQIWFQNAISPLGWVAILVFVLIQIVQVVLPPISHYAVGMLGGFLYGPYWGGLLNWIGRLLGHSIAYYLSRHFGRPFIERHLPSSVLNRFDRYFSGKDLNGFNLQSFLLFLIYFLPLFPDDEISYIVGLTKMKYRTFLVCNFFGHLGGAFGLAYLGSGQSSFNDPFFWFLLTLTLLFTVFMIILGRKARKKSA